MSTAPCTSPESEEEATLPEQSPQTDLSRRTFLKTAATLSAAATFPSAAQPQRPPVSAAPNLNPITLRVNGASYPLSLDTRTSLLDALREHLDLTGSKKGCDHGQCGACTVLLDGRRVNACLTLAVAAEGADITTIEGLAKGDTLDSLHPMQSSFVQHDGFQCGYCTPGQICSAVAAIDEARRGDLSVVSFKSGTLSNPTLTDDEIRERMSGNLCRCGAYPNIVAAVRAIAQQQGLAKTQGATA